MELLIIKILYIVNYLFIYDVNHPSTALFFIKSFRFFFFIKRNAIKRNVRDHWGITSLSAASLCTKKKVIVARKDIIVTIWRRDLRTSVTLMVKSTRSMKIWRLKMRIHATSSVLADVDGMMECKYDFLT